MGHIPNFLRQLHIPLLPAGRIIPLRNWLLTLVNQSPKWVIPSLGKRCKKYGSFPGSWDDPPSTQAVGSRRTGHGATVGAGSLSQVWPARRPGQCPSSAAHVALQRLPGPRGPWGLPQRAARGGGVSFRALPGGGNLEIYAAVGHQERHGEWGNGATCVRLWHLPLIYSLTPSILWWVRYITSKVSSRLQVECRMSAAGNAKPNQCALFDSVCPLCRVTLFKGLRPTAGQGPTWGKRIIKRL